MAQEKVSVAQNLLRPLMLSGNQDQTPFCIGDWNLRLSILKSVTLEIHTMLKHAFPGNSQGGVCVCVLSHFSPVRLFVTLWTVTHQAPLSMGFSKQEHWRGVAMPSSRGSFQPRDQTCISMSPAMAGGFFTTSSTWEAQFPGIEWLRLCAFTAVDLGLVGELKSHKLCEVKWKSLSCVPLFVTL